MKRKDVVLLGISTVLTLFLFVFILSPNLWIKVADAAGTVTKGLIGKEDMNIWKGGTDPRTFTRTTSSGYTQTLTKVDFANSSSACTYGATLSDVVASLGVAETNLRLDCPLTASADISIPSNINTYIENGGSITCSSTSVDLTFSGQLTGDPVQNVFRSCGSVTTPNNPKNRVESVWWSDGGDGTLANPFTSTKDSAAGIIAALATGSYDISVSTGYHYGTKVPKVTDYIDLHGAGRGSTFFVSDNGTYGIALGDPTQLTETDYATVRDMSIFCRGNEVVCFLVVVTRHCNAERLSIRLDTDGSDNNGTGMKLKASRRSDGRGGIGNWWDHFSDIRIWAGTHDNCTSKCDYDNEEDNCSDLVRDGAEYVDPDKCPARPYNTHASRGKGLVLDGNGTSNNAGKNNADYFENINIQNGKYCIDVGAGNGNWFFGMACENYLVDDNGTWTWRWGNYAQDNTVQGFRTETDGYYTGKAVYTAPISGSGSAPYRNIIYGYKGSLAQNNLYGSNYVKRGLNIYGYSIHDGRTSATGMGYPITMRRPGEILPRIKIGDGIKMQNGDNNTVDGAGTWTVLYSGGPSTRFNNAAPYLVSTETFKTPDASKGHHIYFNSWDGGVEGNSTAVGGNVTIHDFKNSRGSAIITMDVRPDYNNAKITFKSTDTVRWWAKDDNITGVDGTIKVDGAGTDDLNVRLSKADRRYIIQWITYTSSSLKHWMMISPPNGPLATGEGATAGPSTDATESGSSETDDNVTEGGDNETSPGLDGSGDGFVD